MIKSRLTLTLLGACAVLAAQRTHLAFLQGEAHVFQCRNTGVELADVFNF